MTFQIQSTNETSDYLWAEKIKRLAITMAYLSCVGKARAMFQDAQFLIFGQNAYEKLVGEA
jgi:hypothetical protein